jgi:hypothetical protein
MKIALTPLFTFILLNLFCLSGMFSQIFYTGTIDKYPIELILMNDDIGFTSGIYVYKNFDSPIYISGKKQIDQWHLEVKDGNGKVTEQLKLYTDSLLMPEIKGIWIDAKTKKMLDIRLTQTFYLENENMMNSDSVEVLQTEATDKYYFKVLLLRKKENMPVSKKYIRIYEKKTDTLLQKIELENEFIGINTIVVNDYNFDGLDDFSVFESSYAGPNTSRTYYLFNPNTKKYFLSEISGVSLEFDAKRKIITEHNQCCAGSRIAINEYKMKNNKMVLVKETCLRWNEKLQKHVIGNIKDCQ